MRKIAIKQRKPLFPLLLAKKFQNSVFDFYLKVSENTLQEPVKVITKIRRGTEIGALSLYVDDVYLGVFFFSLDKLVIIPEATEEGKNPHHYRLFHHFC